MKRRAFVTGVCGQDGSYLAELLLEKDYDVYGLLRRSSTPKTQRIAHLLDDIELVPGDITDLTSLERPLRAIRPDEVYNFAAQSFVATSFATPLSTADATGLGALKLLEAIRIVGITPRIYQASSSEMFGNAKYSPQNEETPLHPASPYGAAKCFAHMCMQVYREAYHMYICNGISFNHESERRGEEFVTRKITKAVGAIKAGQQDLLHLGNLSAQRDWCHAEDVVRGAWLMLQEDTPDDYVLASGEMHSVEEFVEYAFNYAGLDKHQYVRVDPQYLRPMDVQSLCGNATKAHQRLGWMPTVGFTELIRRMVDADCHAEATLARHR